MAYHNVDPAGNMHNYDTYPPAIGVDPENEPKDMATRAVLNPNPDYSHFLEALPATADGLDLFPSPSQEPVIPLSAVAQFGLSSAECSGPELPSEDASPRSPSIGEARDPPRVLSGPNTFTPLPAKAGGRLTREAVRILNNWLTDHREWPYPTEDEKKALGYRTGLTRAQVVNWFANARRRGKVPPAPSSRGSEKTKAVDIPTRPGTPAVFTTTLSKSPMQRWVESPPEHEPASAAAISEAMASHYHTFMGPRFNSPYTGRSTPSARSVDISISSSESFASANSRGSFSSHGSFLPRRRSSRKMKHRLRAQNPASKSMRRPFQCTFCTETFNTKYDWQRHENSLHLPLERWGCMPRGPCYYDEEAMADCCVFCGEANPDAAHLQQHNTAECQGRADNERIFNRKDHLRQHLRLVHGATFSDKPMKAWKIPMPNIRSRCGFCGSVFDTWEERVHHLGDHFKQGKTMRDWTGDWGFDPPILKLLEKSVPPYLIDIERRTPWPFEASKGLTETPPSAYELIKFELAYFMQNHFHRNARLPTSDEMQLEACRIILASEGASLLGPTRSWLRDVFMCKEEISQTARFGTIRNPAESRLHTPKVNGKESLFDDCEFEAQLVEYVNMQQLLDQQVTTLGLQQEACRIVALAEDVSYTPSEFISTWVIKLINSSNDPLKLFRQRSGLGAMIDPKEAPNVDLHSTIHDYSLLEQKLQAFLYQKRSEGHEPTDLELRREARLLIYLKDEGWGQTAADDEYWMSSFRHRHLPAPAEASTSSQTPNQRGQVESVSVPKLPESNWAINSSINSTMPSTQADQYLIAAARSLFLKPSNIILNDANYYQWIKEEMTRWVYATMSPHNPASHVPTDEEIQHYARTISYNDDDPFNFSVADNQIWLDIFKREVGILK